MPGGGKCRPCPDYTSNTLAFALQLGKIMENLSQGNQMALGCSVPNAIHSVDLVIAGDGLDWPVVPCHPWLPCQAMGSTLGHHEYLPSCRTRGFPTSANFESKLLVAALMRSLSEDVCFHIQCSETLLQLCNVFCVAQNVCIS